MAPELLTDLDTAYRSFAAGQAMVVLPRDVVTVTGPDAASFLQGQLSQDLTSLAPGDGVWSLVLEPTGKVGALLFVTRDRTDGYVLDVDAGSGDAVVARLARFKLRTKVDIERREGWTLAVVAATDAPRQHLVDTGGGELFVASAGPVQRYLTDGPRLVVGELPPITLDAFEPWRIEAGLPRQGAELVTGDTIPAEAGQWLIDASVSFTKGCYTGQELVARIDSRGGNVPRHLRGLRIDAAVDAMPPVGTEVVAGDKVVGTLTSVAWSPGFAQPVALAMIGRAVDPPSDATVRWADRAATARVEPLPMRPPSPA